MVRNNALGQPLKIGVFDSGIGGMTVLDELRRTFGDQIHYVYLGDTAHLPYGTKSPAQIEKLSMQCAETLKAKGIDLLVVACNTASSWALSAIQKVMGPIPVVGVVEPGVQAALSAFSELYPDNKAISGGGEAILVLATRATVRSHAYGKALRLLRNDVSVYEQACPLLVPMIEEGWIDHSILHQTISEYVNPYRREHDRGVALLGCTHYPWIHEAFQKALPGWTVVNSAQSVARSLNFLPIFAERLGSPASLLHSKSELSSPVAPSVDWIFTDSDAVPSFVRQWIV